MITVWGRKSSSNVQAVMWCIAELGLPYNRIDAGFHYGVTDTTEYLQMNPNGTVPTIRDDGGPPIFESAAIIRYLCKKYAQPHFWPQDIDAQTPIDQWAEWSKINIALKFTAPIFWKVVRTAPSKQNPQQIRAAIDQFEKNLVIAESRLQQSSWLAGDQFSIADIQFGHVLFRYFDIDIERKELPAVGAYYQRLCNMPRYREHVMVDYEELRVND